MYEKLFDINLLLAAWNSISNKGSAGGIDNISCEYYGQHLEENLSNIVQQLQSHKYNPQPYLECKIPKDGKEYRILSLPTVNDKIIQQAVRLLIEPQLEEEFLDTSYGYRPGKGPVRAIGRVRHILDVEMKKWLVTCDIDDFFDNIPHEKLFRLFQNKFNDPHLTRLIRLWVKMGKISKGYSWKDNIEGIPQGSILSPLLSNMYLHQFDVFMSKTKAGYVRYADDFIILCDSRSDAQKTLNSASVFLENILHLKLNKEKYIRHASKGFEFLGISIFPNKISISPKKFEKIKSKIKDACKLHDKYIAKGFYEAIQGISAYYGRLLPQEWLEKIDDFIIQTLSHKLRNAYQNGILKNKEEIAESFRPLVFVSQEFQIQKAAHIRKILGNCTKKQEDIKKEDSEKPIKIRKREYQKLEAQGMDLIVATPGVHLGISGANISIRKAGKIIEKVRILNLKNISVIAQGISFSSNLINYCASKNISVDFFDFSGKPLSSLFSHVSFSPETGIMQLKALDNGKGAAFAKKTVEGKIYNQINLLKYYHKYRKETDEAFADAFHDSVAKMESIAAEINQFNDDSLDSLRGKLLSVEGRASSVYWDLISKHLDEYIDFETRVRQGAKDTVNCMLNYRYGMLYARVWEAVVRARLNPCISYLHAFQDYKPTLVFDLIEQFRQQAVDRVVFSIITKGEEVKVSNGLLDENTRKRLAEKITARINAVETFRSKETRFINIINEQCRALADFLHGKTKSYKPYLAKW